jgi:hypothetical protein
MSLGVRTRRGKTRKDENIKDLVFVHKTIRRKPPGNKNIKKSWFTSFVNQPSNSTKSIISPKTERE